METRRYILLYDGKCPLCLRMTGWLRRQASHPWVDLIDIHSPRFDPSVYGLTFEQVSGVIHGIQPDGKILRGMDAIREAYRGTRWGWGLAITGWPLLRPLFDALYRWIARHRMMLSRHLPTQG